MRWSLLFSNDSTGADNITIDYTKSFVADELGNRYTMVQDSVNTSPTGVFGDKLPSRTRLSYWVEFPAPTNGAKELTLVLERSGVGPPFPSIVVRQ